MLVSQTASVFLLLLIFLLLRHHVAHGFTPLQQSRRLLFPPTLRPTKQILPQVHPELFTFEQPFYTTCNIKTRMTIIKLDADNIILYSPIAATEECLELVKSIVGCLPTHVVMQSNAIDHTIFLSGWRDVLVPAAQILAVAPSAPTGK